MDADKEFALNLAVHLEVEGVKTEYNILENIRVPIPVCNENDNIVLPGDGSIEEFAKIIGQDFGQAALDVVLELLDLQVYILFKKKTIQKY